jgi:RNA polymerase sigma-70 factor, ECF subfamily
LHQSKEEIEREGAIIRLAQIDPEQFSVLYDRYYRDIFLFVNRRVGEIETAGDLVSQIFLKAMTNLPRYQHKGVPFSAWLYRIAANQVNEYYRKSKKQRVVNLDDSSVSRLMAEADEQPADQTGLLLRLLESLTEDELHLVELRFFEEKPFKEVAYILDITENNAKVKTYRILEKLRKLSQGMDIEESDFTWGSFMWFWPAISTIMWATTNWF